MSGCRQVPSRRGAVVSNVLSYRGYFATVEFDSDTKMLCGTVVGMSDGVYFEADSASCIEQAFHDAVDDYLAFCTEKGKKPEKSYKGTFNVRINPDLHRAATMAAAARNESLNQFVADAITAAV